MLASMRKREANTRVGELESERAPQWGPDRRMVGDALFHESIWLVGSFLLRVLLVEKEGFEPSMLVGYVRQRPRKTTSARAGELLLPVP